MKKITKIKATVTIPQSTIQACVTCIPTTYGMRKMMTEKCNNCEQILKEDKVLRKGMKDFQKLYVEVINENLKLRSELDAAGIYWDRSENIGCTEHNE